MAKGQKVAKTKGNNENPLANAGEGKPVNVGLFNLNELMNNLYSSSGEDSPEVQAIKNTFQANMVQSAFDTQMAKDIAAQNQSIASDAMLQAANLEQRNQSTLMKDEFDYGMLKMEGEYKYQSQFAVDQAQRDTVMASHMGNIQQNQTRLEGKLNLASIDAQGENERATVGLQGQIQQGLQKLQGAQAIKQIQEQGKQQIKQLDKQIRSTEKLQGMQGAQALEQIMAQNQGAAQVADIGAKAQTGVASIQSQGQQKVAGIQASSAEKQTGMQTQSAENIAGMQTASAERQTGMQTQSAENITGMQTASAERQTAATLGSQMQQLKEQIAATADLQEKSGDQALAQIGAQGSEAVKQIIEQGNQAERLGNQQGRQALEQIQATGDQSVRQIGAQGDESVRQIGAQGDQSVRQIGAQGDQSFRLQEQLGNIQSRQIGEQGDQAVRQIGATGEQERENIKQQQRSTAKDRANQSMYSRGLAKMY